MDEYTSRTRVWGFTCPGSPEEVGRVRRWTRDILRESSCADVAELIVSELGSNAVLHTASGDAAGTFRVSLALSDHVVSISVTDAGGTKTAPQVEHPNDDDTHGRGLGMVSALAHHLESLGDHHGHTVTAHLHHCTKDARPPTACGQSPAPGTPLPPRSLSADPCSATPTRRKTRS